MIPEQQPMRNETIEKATAKRGSTVALGGKEYYRVRSYGAHANFFLSGLLADIIPIARTEYISDKSTGKELYLSEKDATQPMTEEDFYANLLILHRIFADYDHMVEAIFDPAAPHNAKWDRETGMGYIYDLEESVNFFFPPDGDNGVRISDIRSIEMAEALKSRLISLQRKVSGEDGRHLINELLAGKTIGETFHLMNHYHGDVGSHLGPSEQVVLFQSTLLARIDQSLKNISLVERTMYSPTYNS